MSLGRSKFYVSTPVEYRHSMLADLSPASSASTLPSIAGSVDCLGPRDPLKKKKKKKGFFASLSSLHKSFAPQVLLREDTEEKKNSSLRHRDSSFHRDSSSQTEVTVAARHEVGVQTDDGHSTNPHWAVGTVEEQSQPRGRAEIVSFLDKPSALKVERSDSPVKHSAKIKTVHFDLSDDPDSNHNATHEIPLIIKKDDEHVSLNDIHVPRNLDKDFEDLLRNLDILVDDPIDTFEVSNKADDLKISFNSCQSSPPKHTLLSTKLRSAFDVLHLEVLPSISENLEVEPLFKEPNEHIAKINPTPELVPPIDPTSIKANKVETNETITKLNSTSELVEDYVEDSIKNNCLTSATQQKSEIKNNPIVLKDDSTKAASVNVFTSSSKSDGGNEGNHGNVYDSENIIKTLSLPTLPSFFDSAPKNNQLDVSSPEYFEIPSTAQPDLELEEKMLSSSRGSVQSNPMSDRIFNAANKKFDSCEYLEQLEDEIIRSLCEPTTREIPDATPVRLLSGDAREYTEDMIEVPESKVNARQTSKHIATITKFDHHGNAPEFESPKQSITNNSSEIQDMCKSNSTSPACKIDPLNKGPPFTGNLGRASNDPNSNERAGVSRTCDFTHCLRVSEVRNNSPFLDKISFKCSPEKSTVIVSSTQDTKTETPNSNGQCDFGHCLKPSQMQNSASHRTASELLPTASNEEKADESTQKSEITIVLQTPLDTLPVRNPSPRPYSVASSDEQEDCNKQQECGSLLGKSSSDNAPSKSPVMMELEKCFEARRRNGPVLLEERVSVEEGVRHVERVFGLPVRHVERERTESATFRPAPPKHPGIGPTEDGLPMAPRHMVKNMHNWYKTMFKSLHKADSSNENQEYIIGYSSEPEISKKEPRKKSPPLEYPVERARHRGDLERGGILAAGDERTGQTCVQVQTREGVSPQATTCPTGDTSRQQSNDNRIPSELQHSPPSDVKLARVMFDFHAQSPKELSLRRGTWVHIWRHLDAHWCEGEGEGGRRGLFPASYVQVPGSATLRFPFAARSPRELSAHKGEGVCLVRRVDARWYEAEAAGGRSGLVPAAFLTVHAEPQSQRHADELELEGDEAD